MTKATYWRCRTRRWVVGVAMASLAMEDCEATIGHGFLVFNWHGLSHTVGYEALLVDTRKHF
jgi:hypothetical protein